MHGYTNVKVGIHLKKANLTLLAVYISDICNRQRGVSEWNPAGIVDLMMRHYNPSRDQITVIYPIGNLETNKPHVLSKHR